MNDGEAGGKEGRNGGGKSLGWKKRGKGETKEKDTANKKIHHTCLFWNPSGVMGLQWKITKRTHQD